MQNHFKTESAKRSNQKEYYKEMIDYYDRRSFTSSINDFTHTGVDRKKINYDLMNNIINPSDFEYITKPWGRDTGSLPANFENRDIISSKIKAVLGIEAKRPFTWKVIAVNAEATTRKEEEEFNRLKDYVITEIFRDLEAEMVAQNISPDMPAEQAFALQQQISQQIQADPPEKVKKYMRREHQDPAEVLAAHILAYLTQKLQLKDKFNQGCKHAAIAAEEIYWIGEVNGEPELKVINPLYVDYDKSQDVQFIQDGEWVAVEYRMTPTDILREFGDELKQSEKEEIYEHYSGDSEFVDFFDSEATHYSLRVLHVVWKGVTKVGFVKDAEGNERVVLSNYKLQPSIGDVSIRYEWIPQVHEGYKIGADKYVRMRPVPNQYKDLDNLYYCKLPYYGAVYDYENSTPTSLVDRMRSYQYLYSILWYRIELLLAQNQGKKALFNINAIPTSAGINLKQFEYFLAANQISYLNTSEEGLRGSVDSSISNLIKEIDLSTTADVIHLQQLAAYISTQCGNAVGVTPQLEGQIQEREAVGNVNKALTLSTNILETFFQTHDRVKRDVLQGLLECAKVAYAKNRPKKINYFLDDLSAAALTVDQELLDASTYGIFVTDSFKTQENQETITQLAHAAMQNSVVDLSTVVEVLAATTIQEAKEVLADGEERMQAKQMQMQQAQQQHDLQMQQLKMQEQQAQRAFEMEKLREEERLKKDRELAKQALLALGFVGNNDINNNQQPDIIEFMQAALEGRKLNLEAKTKEAELELRDKELNIKDKEVEAKAKALKKPKS